MTPHTASIEEFGQLLVRSRLLQALDVQALRRRWSRETFADREDVYQFSQWLIAQDAVTEYQVNLLLRGHVDHCFLDEYKLLDRIGKGRMAGVYKAVHKQGQVVALKVLPPSRVSNPQSLARFHREAKLALRLGHPNVVRTFQLAATPELVYIVMEYLEGETLQNVLQRRGKLPAVEGVRLIYQALLGLQHLHEKRLVHRDLKPSNLMLERGPATGKQDSTLGSTVKILDIGLGKDLLDDASEDVTPNIQLTGENVLLGTPDYLAPEQARNARGVDIRADIYSLGCVLYHVLTGQTPFPESNVFQLILRHATDEPRPVRELEPSVPEGLPSVIRKMIAKHPGERFESPARAAEALRPFLPAHDGSAAEPAPKADAFVNWIENQLNGEGYHSAAATKPQTSHARKPGSAFELSGMIARPTLKVDESELPSASVPTAIMQLSARERTLLDPPEVPVSTHVDSPRRDFMLLAGGAMLGACLLLAVEVILWLFWRGGN